MSEAGIVFVLIAPLAYVDVTSCWRMNSRWSRIAVSAAGMYVELLIAAAALVMWSLTDSVAAKFILYQLVITAGLSTLVFNTNILMRFDGYFILADLIDVPNLQSEASLSIRNLLSRILTGKQTTDRSLGSWRRYFVFAYGVAALLWRRGVRLAVHRRLHDVRRCWNCDCPGWYVHLVGLADSVDIRCHALYSKMA
ncbi:MAG: hypothetical protein R3C56_23345 [Pirellulaceae bacterium]